MMHSLHRSRIDRYFGGNLPAASAAAMFRRLWQCASCRAEYRRHLLLERLRPEGGAEAAEARLWSTIRASAGVAPSGAAPRSRRAWGAALLVAGAAAAFTLAPHRTAEPVARGGSGVALRPSLHLYRSAGGERAEPLAGTLRGGDGVLVAYSNPSPNLGFLMCFAVDGAGRVYWYYPAYEHPGENPAAVPIRKGVTGVELGEEIRHPFQPGPLRFFALFLPAPLHVLDVEDAVRRRSVGDPAGLRALTALPLADATQVTELVEVTP